MLSLKIKQAELALSDGRLDEAFRLVCDKDLTSHRLGQKLSNKLGKKFTQRGGEHLEVGRIEQSLADCNKAAKLLGNTTEVSELRTTIVKAMEQKHHLTKQQAAKLAAARENIEDGWLSVGEEILADENSGEGGILLQNAVAIRTKNQAVIANAKKALDEGYVEEAIEIIKRGRCSKELALHSAELIGRIRKDVCKNVEENLNIGRVDLAERMIEQLDSIGIQSLESDELKRIVKECRKACGYVASGQLSWAAELFAKLKILLPKAKWINEAGNEAKKGANAIEALRTGPLGLMTSRYSAGKQDEAIKQNVSVNRSTQKQDRNMTGPIHSKFMLQVDGVGSYLVLCDNKVTIGPVSSAVQCDVPIVAAADMAVATIERNESDYFIHSKSPIGINDNAVTNRLLANNDKIALSNRCRMKFKKVNSASSTAELEPSGMRFPRADISGIILMNREILIGSGGANHIRTDQVKETVTLHMHQGRLTCKSKESIEIDGKTCGNECQVGIGKQVQIDSMSMVITTVE